MPVPPHSSKPIETVRVAVVSSSTDPIFVRRIGDFLAAMETVCPPMVVDISTMLGLSIGPDQIIDDDQISNQDRAALIANDKWPGLLKRLLSDSSSIAVGGCKQIFRVSTTGVIADLVCRHQVEYLNQRVFGPVGAERYVIEAKHVRLYNVGGQDIDAILNTATVWTTEPASGHTPVYNGCPPLMIDSNTIIGARCADNMQTLTDHVWAADLLNTIRTPPPYGRAIDIVFPRPTKRDGVLVHRPVPAMDWVREVAPRVVGDIDVRGAPSDSSSAAATWLGPMERSPVEESVDDDDRSEIVEFCYVLRGGDEDDDHVEYRCVDLSSPDAGTGRQADRSLGSILSAIGPPPAPEAASWACDHCGRAIEDWYDALIGHACDEASIMTFSCLSNTTRRVTGRPRRSSMR